MTRGVVIGGCDQRVVMGGGGGCDQRVVIGGCDQRVVIGGCDTGGGGGVIGGCTRGW